jgi:hypothetical protein
VKIRRLSEIDLARLASLKNQAELERALRLYNAGGGAWSYEPVRNSTPDILGVRTAMFGAIRSVTWPKIKGQIARACRRGADQINANIQVGKVLFDYARGIAGWSAVDFPMGRLPIGIGESVRYWSDVVLEDNDGLFVAFFDHRREHGIANAEMRRVVFSMQHLWVRERHPDLADARLAIIRFPSSRETRSVRVDWHIEAELLVYEALDARVRNVYETWARVSAEKVRRGGMGGAGGLFGETA